MRPLSNTAATIAIPLDALAGITVTAPPPAYVNQHNVQAVVGIPGRMYLEILRSPGFPLAVTPVGKLRLVDRQAFIDYVPKLPALASMVAAAKKPDAASAEAGPAPPPTVDEIAARWGMKRAAPPAQTPPTAPASSPRRRTR